MRSLWIVAFACALLTAMAPANAGDETYSFKDDDAVGVDASIPSQTEAIGRYYNRGRRFCSQYCYWEVNGRRYCRKRLREAHSQAYYPTYEEQIAPEVQYRPRRR